MAKNKRREEPKQAPDPVDRTWSYGIRLNEAEKSLLFKAAERKGWTPTSLIKTAALERAAAIVNTGTQTTFDFGHLTRHLAALICKPAIVWYDPDDPELQPTDINHFGPPDEAYAGRVVFTTEPAPLRAEDLVRLRTALRLGGVEFANRVIDEAEWRVKDRATLPAPIDPANLEGVERDAAAREPIASHELAKMFSEQTVVTKKPRRS